MLVLISMGVYNLLNELYDRQCHPGTLTELKVIKARMFRVYTEAYRLDAEKLLRYPPEVQFQYGKIMDTWRKIHCVLDSVRTASPEYELEAALDACNALLATLSQAGNK